MVALARYQNMKARRVSAVAGDFIDDWLAALRVTTAAILHQESQKAADAGQVGKRADGAPVPADQVIALNALNPQIAARLVSAFNTWRRYDPARRELMKSQLERIASEEALSPDVYEIVNNALKSAA